VSALARLQADFLRAMLASDPLLPDGLQPGGGMGPGGISAALGMGIYRHAYGARLREALANDHPMLARQLGEARWDALCAGYVAAHPSRLRSLRQFGARLPEYLRTMPPFASSPALSELAAFERALLDSFDAKDSVPADWDALQALPAEDWPMLAPRFVPSLQRLKLQSNCVEVWLALKAGEPAPAMDSSRPRDWMVWRDLDLLTQFRSLDAAEAMALDHLSAGGDFASLCDAMQSLHAAEDVPAAVLSLLARWCADGCIASWQENGVSARFPADTARVFDFSPG